MEFRKIDPRSSTSSVSSTSTRWPSTRRPRSPKEVNRSRPAQARESSLQWETGAGFLSSFGAWYLFSLLVPRWQLCIYIYCSSRPKCPLVAALVAALLAAGICHWLLGESVNFSFKVNPRASWINILDKHFVGSWEYTSFQSWESETLWPDGTNIASWKFSTVWERGHCHVHYFL
jgi:hypothetical protein